MCPPRNTTVQLFNPTPTLSSQTPHRHNCQRSSTIGYLSNLWASCSLYSCGVEWESSVLFRLSLVRVYRCWRAFESAGGWSVQWQAQRRISRRVATQPETQAHAETGNGAVENFRRESRDVRAWALRRRHRYDVDDTVFIVHDYRAEMIISFGATVLLSTYFSTACGGGGLWICRSWKWRTKKEKKDWKKHCWKMTDLVSWTLTNNDPFESKQWAGLKRAGVGWVEFRHGLTARFLSTSIHL